MTTSLSASAVHRIGHVLLDEHVLGFEPLVVEIIGDRLVGVVEIVIGAAMDEFERAAVGRLADGDVAVRRVLRRLRERHCGLVIEAVIVGRREDRHRQAVGLQAFLVDVGFDLLERRRDGVEGLVPGAGALDVDDRPLRSASCPRRTTSPGCAGAAPGAIGSGAAGAAARRRAAAGAGFARLGLAGAADLRECDCDSRRPRCGQ